VTKKRNASFTNEVWTLGMV